MATPKLPFLWPMLAKSGQATRSRLTLHPSRTTAKINRFHTVHHRSPDAVTQRYGTANEPPPHLSDDKNRKTAASDQKSPEQPKAPSKIGEKFGRNGDEEIVPERTGKPGAADLKKALPTLDQNVTAPIQADPMLDSGSSNAENGPAAKQDGQQTDSLLHTVPGPQQHSDDQQPRPQLSAPQPETKQQSVQFDEHSPPVKAPHIDRPRHIHHFDTYGLVRGMVDSGWSESQSITVMKAVRLMLVDNMDLAREALVSKSQVENETYLFRAACAELRTEVTARRKGEQEKMRTERNQLQHEVDIISQRIGQESAHLKDELKGMFDERKMSVRNDQRDMESKIQRLNYQITVDLQADAKEEVEGLRWVMTRRVILALAAVVIMVLGSLKLSSDAAHEQELEAKRKANVLSSGGAQAESPRDFRAVGSTEAQQGRAVTGSEKMVQEGDGPAFVSLG